MGAAGGGLQEASLKGSWKESLAGRRAELASLLPAKAFSTRESDVYSLA